MASSLVASLWLALSTLVRRGLLGSVSGDVSLEQCQGCRLGKQLQLPYYSSDLVSKHPFDLVHSDVWVRLPSFQKEAIDIISFL